MSKYTQEQLEQIESIGRIGAELSLALIQHLLDDKADTEYVERLYTDISTPGTLAYNAYQKGVARRMAELDENLLKLGLGDAADRKAYEEIQRNRLIDQALKDKFNL